MEPVRDNAIIWCWVYYIFILFGSYFALQLFIGAITQSFDRTRKEIGGSALMTKEQQDWMRTRRIITAIRPKRKIAKPANYFRALCYMMCNSKYFEASMVRLILYLIS